MVRSTNKFRLALQRQSKKNNKRKHSLNSLGGDEDETEVDHIEHFMELINEFIDNRIPEEMAEFNEMNAKNNQIVEQNEDGRPRLDSNFSDLYQDSQKDESDKE